MNDEPHFGLDCIPDVYTMPHVYDEEKPFKSVFPSLNIFLLNFVCLSQFCRLKVGKKKLPFCGTSGYPKHKNRENTL